MVSPKKKSIATEGLDLCGRDDGSIGSKRLIQASNFGLFDGEWWGRKVC